MRFITISFLVLCLFSCRTGKETKRVHSSTFIKNFHEGVRLKLNFELEPAIDKFNLCLKEDPMDDASHFALAQLYLMKMIFSGRPFIPNKHQILTQQIFTTFLN